ncbi:MAG: SIMPL domain-containing protein [Sphaerochaetaceae bacterium]|nr:SIMPL domain-containing protein [Sphaerochaetaceae bacterium]
MKFKSILILSIIALMCFTSCSTLSKNSAQVSVSGKGIVYLQSDMVTFSINVDESAPTTSEAQQLTNQKISTILDILKAFDVKDEDINTTALNFGANYDWVDGNYVKSGESVSQTIYVIMRNVDKFPSLVDQLGAQLSGIDLYSINFDSSQKADAYEKARELAYQDALEKAQTYASQTGFKTVVPVEVSEGNSSYGNATYADVEAAMAPLASSATYKTQAPSGRLSVTVNMQATFLIK